MQIHMLRTVHLIAGHLWESKDATLTVYMGQENKYYVSDFSFLRGTCTSRVTL